MRVGKLYDVIREDVGGSFVMLQNNEALILEALTQDTSAGNELRTLAADLFSLLEVMIADEKERQAKILANKDARKDGK